MRYLKKFNESNYEDLYRSITDREFKKYSGRKKEIITKDEFERLKSIQDKYYKSEDHKIKYDENRTHYTFFNYDKNFKSVLLPIEVTKIEDDWWIVTYTYNVDSFPDDCHFVCDTLDGVEEYFREEL